MELYRNFTILFIFIFKVESLKLFYEYTKFYIYIYHIIRQFVIDKIIFPGIFDLIFIIQFIDKFCSL